jgi:hypothetical protein
MSWYPNRVMCQYPYGVMLVVPEAELNQAREGDPSTDYADYTDFERGS